MKARQFIQLVSGTMVALLANAATAGMLIDTSPDAVGTVNFSNQENLSSQTNYVTQFTVDGEFALTGIDTYLQSQPIPSSFAGASVVVRIYRDNNGIVGGLIAEIGSVISLVDFDGATDGAFVRRHVAFDHTLVAGTYWIGVAGSTQPIGQLLVSDFPTNFPTARMSGTQAQGVLDDTDLGNQAAIRVFGQLNGIDSDNDGVDDLLDNCTDVANADQTDSNGDGYGNACDADLNNDCLVGVTDLGMIKLAFFTSDADADLNGDGIVNIADLGMMRAVAFTRPGPSVVGASCD